MLRGEAISWLYTMIFLDALYMVRKDMETKPNSESLSLQYEGYIYYTYFLVNIILNLTIIIIIIIIISFFLPSIHPPFL